MEPIAVTEYKITSEKIMEFYYAKYKVNYDEFSKEIYDTMPDNMKEMRVEFFEDRFVLENLMKSEKNTYLYDDLFAIEKVGNGYLFYYNKTEYYFSKFSNFSIQELGKLDDILRKYYEKAEYKIIAEIENFEWTAKKIRMGMRTKFKMAVIATVLGYFTFGIISSRAVESLMPNLIGMIIIFLISFYAFKIVPEKTLKSMNPKLIKMRVLFYEEHMVLINKLEPKIIQMKYNEFYKIKKIKSGYLLYGQRNQFYLVEFSEMTGNIEELKNIIKEVRNDK